MHDGAAAAATARDTATWLWAALGASAAPADMAALHCAHSMVVQVRFLVVEGGSDVKAAANDGTTAIELAQRTTYVKDCTAAHLPDGRPELLRTPGSLPACRVPRLPGPLTCMQPHDATVSTQLRHGRGELQKPCRLSAGKREHLHLLRHAGSNAAVLVKRCGLGRWRSWSEVCDDRVRGRGAAGVDAGGGDGVGAAAGRDVDVHPRVCAAAGN